MVDETKVEVTQDNTVVTETETKTEPTTEIEPNTETKSLINQEIPETKEPGAETEEPEEKEETKEPEVPEDYGDFEMPEGVEVDPELMGKAKETFKELGLTKDQAQKLVSLQAESVKEAAKKQIDAYTSLKNEWAEQTKKELGANFPKEMSYAKKAVTQFFDEKGQKFFDESGLGNNPDFIRGLIKIGKEMSEDETPPGNPGSEKKDGLAALYPSMSK
jgi:hypothetical protein